MKKTISAMILTSALALSLCACGSAPATENTAPAIEPQIPAEAPAPAGSDAQITPAEPSAPVRQDGERYDTVITLEGMEETVHYEHVRNEALGFEMDYDYESLVRRSEAGREYFISVWDDPVNPENYLEVSYDTDSAEVMASAVRASLSQEYDLLEETIPLALAGDCIRIEASELKGQGVMADTLQVVYIIPAPDGCRVAAEHFSIESAEGFGRRFRYMLDTLSVLDLNPGGTLSEDLALAAIREYCMSINPELESIVNNGEYQVSWEIASSDENQIVVLFRSYTGAEVRYYIDRATGDAYATEFVPGITPEEERTDESLNVWDYCG